MAHFIKPFRGVPKGEIYPVQFAVGDPCPPELESGALSVGAITLSPTPATILLGSDLQPAQFHFEEGVEVLLGDVVALAHRDSGLSAEDWNALSVATRESAIAEVVQRLSAEAAEKKAAAAAASAAVATAAVADETPSDDKAALIVKLEASSIPFDKRWGVEKLAAALADGKKD
ncbi:hypothetical protein [uncultured Stenotrophomonas sp.]|uniref:hypothetical protein n=1 Tax=uncultured Stenotrophomonas sp. TaxID=165438 RepID=UPI0025CCD14D|nr:hypothetical protein [uncultured Stenotrophomonas sp.]